MGRGGAEIRFRSKGERAMINKEEKLRLCELIRAGSKCKDTRNPYIDSKSLLKYKGRAWDSRFWCCRHTKKGGRMYKFGLKELAPGGDSYNRQRNGKERFSLCLL